MSYADKVFVQNINDILEHGVSDRVSDHHAAPHLLEKRLG